MTNEIPFTSYLPGDTATLSTQTTVRIVKPIWNLTIDRTDGDELLMAAHELYVEPGSPIDSWRIVSSFTCVREGSSFIYDIRYLYEQ